MVESKAYATVRKPSVLLVGVFAVLVAVLLSLFARELWREREERMYSAAREISRLTRVLKEHALRTIHAAEVELIGISESLSYMPPSWRGDRVVVSNLLKSRLGRAPHIRNILVLDALGRDAGDASGLPSAASLVDREYFTALRDRPGIDTHVSEPARSVTTGQWYLAVSRTLRAPDGAFDGAVVALVEPAYFSDFFRIVAADSRMSIELMTDSGVLIASEASPEPRIGQHVPHAHVLRADLAVRPTGLYRAEHGTDRMIGFRKVPSLPLVVVAAVDVGDVLAGWYEIVVSDAIVLAIVSLVVGCLAIVLFRQIRRGERSEETARESEHLLRQALDAVPAGISIKDASSCYILINRSVRDNFGLGDMPVAGRRETDLFVPEVADRITTQDRVVFETGVALPFHEETVRRAEGDTRIVLRGKYPVFAGRDRARVTHLVTATLDISERKRLERQLTLAKAAAETANRSKSTFLANMSHELRTPLNAVIGFAEIMERRMFGRMEPRRYEGYLQDILGSARHLLGVINDILDLSRVEAGQAVLDEMTLDVGEIVRSSLRFVNERAHAAGIGLSTRLAPDLPALRADPRKMKQVLINLLSNAVKFTSAGGAVAIEARLKPGGQLCIAVADTGVGIAKDDLRNVFRPFQQISAMLSRNVEGSGLGLAITKSLVDLHGGDLAIESELGKGTVVTVTLPAARLVASPPVAVAS